MVIFCGTKVCKHNRARVVHISSQQYVGKSCSRCHTLCACLLSSFGPLAAQLRHLPCDWLIQAAQFSGPYIHVDWFHHKQLKKWDNNCKPWIQPIPCPLKDTDNKVCGCGNSSHIHSYAHPHKKEEKKEKQWCVCSRCGRRSNYTELKR